MKTKKLLSFALVLAMLVGMLPGMSLTANATGSTTTITSPATTGTMTITLVIKEVQASADNVSVAHDGQPHGITVNVTEPTTGYTVKYGTAEGTYDLDASPTQTEIGTLTVYYQVTANNYAAKTGSATITVSAKQPQTITAADVTATYGDKNKSVSASVTTPATDGGALSYAVKSGDAVTVDASGNLTINKAGSAVITVTAAETADYALATKDVTVTVNPKTLTIKAKDQSIKVGDAVPTLSGADFYTVTGLVGVDALATAPTLSYSSTPDNTKAGTYTITPSGAAVPSGGNYNEEITYQTGTLTISAKSVTPSHDSSDDSGSSYTPSTPSTPSTPTTEQHTSETATAADGSNVTTELDTSTTTTTNKDGSVTVTDKATETVKTEGENGSVVETKTETVNAETTDSKKNADGSVTDTTKVSNTETVTQTATDANGGKTITETKTEQDHNTAVTTKDNADGSKTEKTETTETVKVTEQVKTESGKVLSETFTEKTTETKTDMTTNEDGTATGTSTTTTTVKDDKGNVLSTAVTEAEITAKTDENGMVTTETAATTTTTDANGNETVEKTVTTENKTPDGSTGTIVKDESGNILSQSTTISQQEAEAARDEGRPAQSPLTVTPVPEAAEDNAQSVQVNMPAVLYDKDGDGVVTVSEMAKVEIQVTYTGPGVVAKEKDANGNLTRITECYEGSVIVPVTGTGEIVIVDNTKTFADVAKNDWYNEYVTFVTAREIFNGTGDGNFNPNGTMNRAMLAQVLYNFARGAKEGDGTVFSDVNAGDWFNAAIGWAYENKVVNGYGDRFGASDNISRQDMATILYRYAKAAGYDVSKSASLDGFADAGDVADYAKEAMRWAVGMGLIDGIDGRLAPTGNATRAQVAAIMTRFVRNAK